MLTEILYSDCYTSTKINHTDAETRPIANSMYIDVGSEPNDGRWATWRYANFLSKSRLSNPCPVVGVVHITECRF